MRSNEAASGELDGLLRNWTKATWKSRIFSGARGAEKIYNKAKHTKNNRTKKPHVVRFFCLFYLISYLFEYNGASFASC